MSFYPSRGIDQHEAAGEYDPAVDGFLVKAWVVAWIFHGPMDGKMFTVGIDIGEAKCEIIVSLVRYIMKLMLLLTQQPTKECPIGESRLNPRVVAW
jgi:hypothetical protein